MITELAQSAPKSNQEILDSCLEIDLKQYITFVPDHELTRHELDELVMLILEKRKKEGRISLYMTKDSGLWKIRAHCFE